eukprot:scaffold43566_cov29-Phaeocystis_antarctica.AAC.1
MSVTLDVSKLSGWLKADAPCRVEKRAYDAGRGAERKAEGVGAVAAQAAQAARMGRAQLEGWEGPGTRGAHEKHVPHTRDVGRVEAQRLIEHHRLLPSRKEGIRCGTRCDSGGKRA